MRVVIDGDRSTHDVSLSDGRTTIGFIVCDSEGNHNPIGINRKPIERMAIKTTTGNVKWGDFEYPWTPVAQEDFSSGLGRKDYDSSSGDYYFGYRVNTAIGNKVMLGGAEHHTFGLRKKNTNLSHQIEWHEFRDNYCNGIIVKFTTSEEYSAKYLYLHVKKKGKPSSLLTVKLYSDNNGELGNVLYTYYIRETEVDERLGILYQIALSPAVSLSASTSYWIYVSTIGGDIDNHWMVGTKDVGGATKYTKDLTNWENAQFDLYYLITDEDNYNTIKFFTYYGQLHCIVNPATGAPKLYMLGDKGVADSNSSDKSKLIDATKNWATDEWAGCVVRIVGGKGSSEEIPYRRIISNDKTSLTVDKNWIIEHDTTTTYVIIGGSNWKEITGHGLTQPVTSVRQINAYCYFCQGLDTNIRRWRWYNSSGNSTNEFADEGTTKALYIEFVRNTEVWIATRTVLRVASAPTSWADMTFTQVANFTDSCGWITNLVNYDDKCYVFREGKIHAATAMYSPPVVDDVPLKEMMSTKSILNGTAATQFNQYLYFNWGYMVNRYASSSIDSIGYNSRDGLPADYIAICSDLANTPGILYAAADGYGNAYSAIYAYNNIGWCLIYAPQSKNLRIRNLYSITIDGYATRLYFTVNNDVMWLELPYISKDPTFDNAYRYTHQGYLVTGYVYSNLIDAYKSYKELKIFAENLGKDTYIVVDFQLDNDDTWYKIEDYFDESPISERYITTSKGITGKRIRLRIWFYTNDASKTPLLKAYVVDTVVQATVKYSYTFNYRIVNNDVNLLGEQEDISGFDKQKIIDEWAANLTPLTMYSAKSRFNNKAVFISPTASNVMKAIDDGYVESIILIER